MKALRAGLGEEPGSLPPLRQSIKTGRARKLRENMKLPGLKVLGTAGEMSYL